MSHATSTTTGSPVVLDWRHAYTGPPAPCVLCQGLTTCRSPTQGVPCHKGCAETRINRYATIPADRARLTAAHTPRKGVS
jgi:hypothetical protein